MVTRVLVTGVMLLLAAGGFFGAPQIPADPLDPFGILFLTIAGVMWFAWHEIREGFSYGAGLSRDRSELPLAAGFGAMFIKGVTNACRTAPPQGRSSEADSKLRKPLAPILSPVPNPPPQTGEGRVGACGRGER
jgi:hypothetical protein